MLRLISIILCAIAINAQTNLKPYRLLVANGKLVISGGKILNHQTYITSRTAPNEEHGWELSVVQTNDLVTSAPEDFDSIHAALAVDGNLFRPFAYVTNSGPMEIAYGWTDYWPVDPKYRQFHYTYWNDFVNPTISSYFVRGVIAAPMFSYNRPIVPLSELVRIDVGTSASAKLATFTGESADLPSTAGDLSDISGSASISGGSTDTLLGVLVIPSDWATIPGYTVVSPAEENDYSWDYLDIYGFRHAGRELNQTINRPDFTNPATNVIWRFTAKKEYY